MDYRTVAAWALGWSVAIAGAHAEDPPSEKKPGSTPVAARDGNSNVAGDLASLLDRVERLSAQLGQIADAGDEAESREVAQQCRELLSTLRELVHRQSVKTEAPIKLPRALEAIRELACEGDNCPIDGKLVENQDLKAATVGELFARLRDIQITDEEREQLAGEVEKDGVVEFVEVVVKDDDGEDDDGEDDDEDSDDEDGQERKEQDDEEKQLDKRKQKLEAAENRRQKRELEAFVRSIAAKVQEAQRLDNPAQKIERLRDIAGAIRERAGDVVENDAERAFEMLRNAERIESQAREIARRFDNERTRLQRGEWDEPPARPQAGMVPPGMMGPPPGPRPDGVAGIPQDARGKAMMAQRLLMAAGLKKEANIVAQAIEREFAATPDTVKRLRAEIAELQAINAKLRAVLENREAAFQEQLQDRIKEAMKEDRDDDEDEDDE